METKNITISGQATPEQIAEWKKTAPFGSVYELTVEVPDKETKKCYLKHADRKILGCASVEGGLDPIKFNEIIINNCWLGGDEEIRTNDEYFLACGKQLDVVLKTGSAVIKKL